MILDISCIASRVLYSRLGDIHVKISQHFPPYLQLVKTKDDIPQDSDHYTVYKNMIYSFFFTPTQKATIGSCHPLL